VYTRQGRLADAQATQQRLASIEPAPPFHYFHRGLEALKQRDYAQAKTLFQKEVSRSAYYHEFHFGLALALLGLGELDEARRQMAMAMASSTRPTDRELYAGKLERMKGLRVQ
jgi:tetratricopeptide (TPR) repeat protein